MSKLKKNIQPKLSKDEMKQQEESAFIQHQIEARQRIYSQVQNLARIHQFGEQYGIGEDVDKFLKDVIERL